MLLVCARALLVLILFMQVDGKGTRDKRTLDLVLRSVADVFGYDVQKRPAVLPQPPMPPPRPTFFPPPVKPLPPIRGRVLPAPRAAAPMTPVLAAPMTPALAVPMAPLPMAPPPAPATPTAPTAAPMVPAKAPAAAPVPMPPAIAPPANTPRKRPAMRPQVVPNTPPAPAPPRPTVPPLLTENIRKTFNIAFNYNRGIQTQAPPAAPITQAPAPAAPPAPSAPPAPPATQLPPAPRPKIPRPFRPPPPSKAPPPPTITTIPKPPSPPSPTMAIAKPPPPMPANPPPSPMASNPPPPKSPVAPKAAKQYNEYDEDYNQNYDNKDPDAYYDYQDNEAEDAPPQEQVTHNYDDSKQRFRQSVEAFWEGSPWIQNNNGYKYLTDTQEPSTNKYEEYPLPEESQQKKRKYPKKTRLVKPQYYGVLPVPLHKLDDKPHPGAPIPFDAELAATDIKNRIEEAASQHQPVVTKYEPDTYDPSFAYETPEHQAYDYKQHEKLTAYEDSDSDLSPNSRRSESQSGTQIMLVSMQPNVTQSIY